MPDRLVVDLGTDDQVMVQTWLDGELPEPVARAPLACQLDGQALEDLHWYLEDYLQTPFGCGKTKVRRSSGSWPGGGTRSPLRCSAPARPGLYRVASRRPSSAAAAGAGSIAEEEKTMVKGFKNFLMQRDLIVVAVGLVVALAFSTLVKAFTDNVITPLVNAAGGGGAAGKGLGWTLNGQRIDLGAFISAIIYFVIFMAVVYFLIVVPYRSYMKRRGTTVFGDPPPTQTCPNCKSADLPADATICKYCASQLAPPAEPAGTPA